MSGNISESPDMLYKYKSVSGDGIEYVRQIINDNCIYLSVASDFNDPFDSNPIYVPPGGEMRRKQYLRHIIRERVDSLDKRGKRRLKSIFNGVSPITFREIACRSGADVLGSVGIYSLSELNDSILMWSHYADSHRGVCLGFLTGRYSIDFPSIINLCYSIEYKEARPILDTIGTSDRQSHWNVLFTKSKEWSYEKEWRIVSNDGRGLQKIPDNCLKEIILGAKISDIDRKKIIQFNKSRKFPAKILQATLNDRLFKIDIL